MNNPSSTEDTVTLETKSRLTDGRFSSILESTHKFNLDLNCLCKDLANKVDEIVGALPEEAVQEELLGGPDNAYGILDKIQMHQNSCRSQLNTLHDIICRL